MLGSCYWRNRLWPYGLSVTSGIELAMDYKTITSLAMTREERLTRVTQPLRCANVALYSLGERRSILIAAFCAG